MEQFTVLSYDKATRQATISCEESNYVGPLYININFLKYAKKIKVHLFSILNELLAGVAFELCPSNLSLVLFITL